jgi:hypothetical protein
MRGWLVARGLLTTWAVASRKVCGECMAEASPAECSFPHPLRRKRALPRAAVVIREERVFIGNCFRRS